MENQTSSTKSVNKKFGYDKEYLSTFKKKMFVDFKKEILTSTDPFSPTVYDIEKAYTKLMEIWNRDVKSRNFLKHLVMGFLPNNPFNKVLDCKVESKSDLKCAILNYQLATLRDISVGQAKIGTKITSIKALALVDNRKLTSDEIREIKTIQDSEPIYIRKYMFAYFSEKSDKYISNPAMFALTFFVSKLIESGYGDEILNLVKRERREIEVKKAEKKFTQKKASFSLSDAIDLDILEKLKSIK